MKRLLFLGVFITGLVASALANHQPASATFTFAVDGGTANGPTNNPNPVLPGSSGPFNTPNVSLPPYLSCGFPDGGPTGCQPGAFRILEGTGYRVTLCAPSTGTLAGGSLLDYYWSNGSGALNVWSRNPSIDETVTVGTASCNGTACRCQTFPDRIVAGMGDGWLMLVPANISLSDAGVVGSVTETIDATVQP